MRGGHRDGRCRGVALVFVLWVLTLLSVIVAEFCVTTRGEMAIAWNFKEETVAYYLAEAGVEMSILQLLRASLVPQRLRTPEELEREAEEGIALWRVNTEIPPIPFGDGEFRVFLGNESGKVNLNTADERLLMAMLGGFELGEAQKALIVDSIQDWRDEDDLHRQNGAEDAYYRGLKPPYGCKNGDFDTVEELLLVRGVTPELFWKGLRDIVTVYGGPVKMPKGMRRRVGTGTEGININAASPRLLRGFPFMTDAFVDAVVDYRRTRDIKSQQELAMIIGDEASKALAPFIGFTLSPYYTIASVGRGGEGRVERGVEALVQIDGRTQPPYRILQWTDALMQAER